MDHKAIAEWAMSGTTGASAEAIASNLTGIGKKRGDYPHDGGDFGRCERLLDMVPELRPRLHEMAGVNKYWAALIPRWEEIRATPKDGRYDLIQSIIRPLEDDDPSVIRLGKGAAMRFGGIS